MNRADSAILRELAGSVYATLEQRAALERVIPRLRAEEEEQERQRRAEDDTQRLAPVRR